MKYLNIHTHNKEIITNSISVFNVFPDSVPQIDIKKHYSIGIHPWYVKNGDKIELLKKVNQYLSKDCFVACGEIGLDRNYPNYDLQKEIFTEQLLIAQNFDKPVIIHNVKSSSEIISIIKQNKITVPKIIHRYSGNITSAEQLTKLGFYLSFGHSLFNEKSKIKKVFKKLPLSNLFLETDDSEKSIIDIYEQAYLLRDEDKRTVKISLLQNYIDLRRYTIFNQYYKHSQ